MTGYAQIRAHTSAGELTIALRAVNHRGLDLHFHQDNEIAAFENAMRAILKRHIARGHVEIRISLTRNLQGGVASYNPDVLRHYVSLFQQACEELRLDNRPDLNTLFTMPGVFETAPGPEPLNREFEAEVIQALDACIVDLNAYREREGRELGAALEREMYQIDEQISQITAIRQKALPCFQQRLRDRLRELLSDSTLPESRLAEEAALLSERSDIQEELTRLEIHVHELRRILQAGGELGKRLDFLLQEMNRETNTVLSKTSGTGEPGLAVTSLGLGIKANIERIREQALNLE